MSNDTRAVLGRYKAKGTPKYFVCLVPTSSLRNLASKMVSINLLKWWAALHRGSILASHSVAPGNRKFIFDAAEIHQRRWLVESRQRLENVD